MGGTILGTSRTNPYEGERGGAENIAKTLYGHKIDGIVAIGGEGTLAAADRLAKDGIKVLGVPKTIDNDLRATDYSFGFDTAVNIATDAMDRLRTTGDSTSAAWSPRSWVVTSAGSRCMPGWPPGPTSSASPRCRCRWTRSPLSSRAPTIAVVHRSSSSPRASSSPAWTRPTATRAWTRSTDRGWAASATCSPRDRADHGHRDPRHDPRPHPARRLAVGVRPRPRDPPRPARRRRHR